MNFLGTFCLIKKINFFIIHILVNWEVWCVHSMPIFLLLYQLYRLVRFLEKGGCFHRAGSISDARFAVGAIARGKVICVAYDLNTVLMVAKLSKKFFNLIFNLLFPILYLSLIYRKRKKWIFFHLQSLLGRRWNLEGVVFLCLLFIFRLEEFLIPRLFIPFSAEYVKETNLQNIKKNNCNFWYSITEQYQTFYWAALCMAIAGRVLVLWQLALIAMDWYYLEG
jgi:hypothetical protein